MNYPNVLEMPIDHAKEDITEAEIEQILEYNLNDVLATFEFYKLSQAKIELRKSLLKQYKIPCLNWSDPKIGENIVLKLYSSKTGQNPWDVKNSRSYRSKIALNDCILPHIEFQSEPFKKLLKELRNRTVVETKRSVSESVIYKGFKYDFGTGGIHGCIKPGVYEADSKYIIIDADVASLYPSLSIKYNFYPEHLGKDFVQVYKNIVDLRLQAKKEGNTTLADGFKLSANGTYGKSNDINSFLYDPKFTLSITLNGQLLLAKLAESIVNSIEDLQVLQINTDGITIRLLKSDLDKYYQICKEWEKYSNLTLEYVEYTKMIIGDVNNYSAIKLDGKVKNKGRFEITKVVGSEIAYNKDNSFKIVPIALQEYFTKGTPIQETIKNHINIYDFCGRQKFKRDSIGKTHSVDYRSDGTAYEKIEVQQKNTRYFISNTGSTFIKYYNKGTIELINAGYLVTIFNKYIERNDYNINYNFYIKEAQKEINNIQNKQLQLI